MWLKLQNGDYVQPETGSKFGTNVTGDNDWSIYIFCQGRSNVAQSGYATKDDAQAALDEFMVDHDYAQLQPPATKEETDENE